MTIAINKLNWAIIDDISTVDKTKLSSDWIIGPIFDDPVRAFVVGQMYWVVTGQNIHVMTDSEYDSYAPYVTTTKTSRKEDVTAYRDQKLYSGFTDLNGISWGTSVSDIANLNAVCTLINSNIVTNNVTWRDANNINHSLTPTQMLQLAGELASRAETIYFTSWQHKANIDALTTISAVSAYDITTGWPA